MLKSPVSRTLRALISVIDTMDQDDIEQLIAGKGRLIYQPYEKAMITKHEMVDQSLVIDQLNGANDRESAKNVLDEIKSKEALQQLGKHYKIYISKSDRREEIINKIIEGVVGRRLGTDAIQTLNLNGSNEPLRKTS